MIFLIVYIFSIIRGSILMLTALAFYPLLLVLFRLNGRDPQLSAVFLNYFLILSIPLAGMLAAHFIEKNVSNLNYRNYISRVAFIVTVALCLQSIRLTEFLFAAFRSAEINSISQITAVIINSSNACLKSAAIAACVVLLLINLAELPFVWFSQAFGFTNKARVAFSGLRPALAFLIIIYTFDFAVDLFSRKMWPDLFL